MGERDGKGIGITQKHPKTVFVGKMAVNES
jgi:hypothetical protein